VPRPRDGDSARTTPRRDPTTPARPSIADLLARLLAERRRRAGYDAGEAWGKLPPEAPRLRLGGCLLRFMLLMLILLVLAFAGSFLFVGSMLQFFSADVVQTTALLSGTLEQRAPGISS
jgi:hypothetical protein